MVAMGRLYLISWNSVHKLKLIYIILASLIQWQKKKISNHKICEFVFWKKISIFPPTFYEILFSRKKIDYFWKNSIYLRGELCLINLIRSKFDGLKPSFVLALQTKNYIEIYKIKLITLEKSWKRDHYHLSKRHEYLNIWYL